jgi:O-antigen/teichoic acid export membrane protein
MQFEAEFRFLVLKRLSGFFLMVMLVWIMRSFWALAAGNIIAAFSGVVLSYIMHPMRPRLSLAKFQDIFSISQWMLLKNIGEYFNTNLQKIFVGRWSSTEILGAYTLANKISIMPSSELLAPFNRVLFPAFSKVKDDFQELKRLFLLAQGLQTLIAIPVAVGLALVAHNAVPLILGEKWIKVIPFVQILALIGIIQAIIGTSGYIMIVLGHMRLNVLVTFFQIIVFAVLVVFGFSGSNALVIAWVQLISGVGGMFLAFYLLIRVFPVLKISELFSNSIRPLLGVITMTAVLKFLDSNLELSPVLALSFHVAVGIFIYVLVVLLAWWISKCPSGAESYLLEKIYGIFKNLLELKKKIV